MDFKLCCIALTSYALEHNLMNCSVEAVIDSLLEYYKTISLKEAVHMQFREAINASF